MIIHSFAVASWFDELERHLPAAFRAGDPNTKWNPAPLPIKVLPTMALDNYPFRVKTMNITRGF